MSDVVPTSASPAMVHRVNWRRLALAAVLTATGVVLLVRGLGYLGIVFPDESVPAIAVGALQLTSPTLVGARPRTIRARLIAAVVAAGLTYLFLLAIS